MPVKQPKKRSAAQRAGILADNETRRVSLYARTSGDEQKDAGTIETQAVRMRQYMAAHPDWKLVGEYMDDSQSGFSLRLGERAHGRRLVADVEAGLVDTVLVFKFDRLGRKLLFAVEALDFLKTHGVSVISVSDGIDTSTKMGEMMAGQMAQWAQMERDAIVDRTAAGRDRHLTDLAHGCPWLNGPVPPGYRLEARHHPGRKKPGQYLAIDPETAPVWEEVFNRIAMGSSAIEEVRRLRALNVPADVRYPHFVRPGTWGLSRVLKILHNPVYRGSHEVYLSNGDVSSRPCPAIVGPGVWDAVQARLVENRRMSRKGHTRAYRLGGLLFCAYCQKAYTGATNRGRAIYRCNGAARTATLRLAGVKCEGSQVPALTVEKLVWDRWVQPLFDDPEGAIRETAKLVREQQERAAGSSAEQERLRTLIAEKEKEQDTVRKMTRRRMYSFEQGEKELADLEAELGILRGQLASLRVAGEMAEMAAGDFASLVETLGSDIRDEALIRKAAGDEAWLRQMLGGLIARIEVRTQGARQEPGVVVYPMTGNAPVDITTRRSGGGYLAFSLSLAA